MRVQFGGPSSSCLSLKPLSGLECDGWTEEDPGIQASACSSFVQSSEDRDSAKNISIKCLFI